MKIKRNRDFIYLAIIYIVSVALYAYIAKKMTIPIYRWVDEDLHVALAKSFHYHYNFRRNYQPVGEYSVFYSIFLSIAYFFYTPENIVDIMRFISLAVMCTVVYPVYLLAGHILGKKSWIWYITILSVAVPELFYGMYLLQETLAYPLVIWVIYLIYRRFDSDAWKPGNIIIPIFLAITFWTKTSLIVVAIAYYLTEFIIWICNIRHKKNSQLYALKNMYISVSFFFVLVVLSQVLIMALNGFKGAESHYIAQISQIFPINAGVIKRIAEGCVFYVVFLLLTFGILPIVVPISCIKNMEKKDIYWFVFFVSVIILTILEVVFTIVLPEELPNSYITRIHMRFFFYYFLPIFILFLKYQQKCEFNWKSIIGILLTLSMSVYFVIQSSKLIPDYIDSIVWFCIHSEMNEYPKLGIMILLVEVIISIIFVYWKNAKKVYCQFLMIGIGVLMLFRHNYDHINKIGMENKAIQDELIEIVEDTNKCERIYLAATSLTNPVMAFSNYSSEDIRVIILLYDYKYHIKTNSAIVIPNDLLAEYQLGSRVSEIVDYGYFSVIYNGESTALEKHGTIQIMTTRAE